MKLQKGPESKYPFAYGQRALPLGKFKVPMERDFITVRKGFIDKDVFIDPEEKLITPGKIPMLVGKMTVDQELIFPYLPENGRMHIAIGRFGRSLNSIGLSSSQENETVRSILTRHLSELRKNLVEEEELSGGFAFLDERRRRLDAVRKKLSPLCGNVFGASEPGGQGVVSMAHRRLGDEFDKCGDAMAALNFLGYTAQEISQIAADLDMYPDDWYAVSYPDSCRSLPPLFGILHLDPADSKMIPLFVMETSYVDFGDYKVLAFGTEASLTIGPIDF